MHIDFNSILIPLSAALGLSLTVERILEFISNIWERLLGLQRIKKIPDINPKTSVITNLEKLCFRSEGDDDREREAEKNVTKRHSLIKRLHEAQNLEIRTRLKSELEVLDFDTVWGEDVDTFITLVEPANDPDDGKTLKYNNNDSIDKRLAIKQIKTRIKNIVKIKI